MKSVLEEIYFELAERNEVLKNNKEYEERSEAYSKNYELLQKGLTKEQKKILEGLWLAGAGQEGAAACAYFKEGFRTCLKIMAECHKA